MSTPTSRRRLIFCLVAVAALIALDLWSKARVFEWLEADPFALTPDSHGHPREPLLGDWLGFMRNENYGMAFGRGENMPYILVFGRIGAVLLLAWLVLKAPRGRSAYLVALVLILSGALGNLYDNLFRPIEPADGRPFGPVRDFIDVYFGIWDWHFPTFNVADSCISVGAVLLILSGFGADEEAEQEDAEGLEAAAGEPATEQATS
ncbi:MAG: signal peptidase II [Chlamydiales bacterium]|jgi:signal peptidase II